MIKARGQTPKGPLLVFGLSEMNIERLRAGQPIHVDLREMGVECDFAIFAGKTEATMARDLADLIGPDTKFKDTSGSSS